MLSGNLGKLANQTTALKVASFAECTSVAPRPAHTDSKQHTITTTKQTEQRETAKDMDRATP